MDLVELFYSRPFKIRNADEYDLERVLDLFVDPIGGLTSPFDFENTIIKGRMGSGKTMYLRANHAFYLYGLVQSLLDSQDVILPVLIRLNHFQHLKEPSDIYRAVIVKVVEEMTSAYLHLMDAHKLVDLHSGIKSIAARSGIADRLSLSIRQLAKLGSEEYLERISAELGLKGEVKNPFISMSANWQKNQFLELKRKPNPGIKDVEECYANLLQGHNGKILLLIDEAGSLDNRFFREDATTTAYFEVLMNQFRTASFIRTKIAVYPNSYSDMLTETRYGNIVKLEYSVKEQREYDKYRERVLKIMDSYINSGSPDLCVRDVFDVDDSGVGDSVEQMIYASNGNVRRLINILDQSMVEAYNKHSDRCFVDREDAVDAIMNHSLTTESLFTADEKIFLQRIADACRSRSTYRFSFPAMSPILYRYTNKSQEYNPINIDELGAGRKGNVYSFDYSYCLLKNVPTHYVSGSERIDRDRTLKSGVWIERVTQLNQEIIDQAELPGKLDGQIEYVKDDAGFVRGDDGGQYFFMRSYILDTDKDKSLFVGKRVRFFSIKINDTNMATNVEVL